MVDTNKSYKVLMSINPEFARKILSGEKKFEYRKVVPKRMIKTIVIYETYPIKQVTGEVEVNGVCMGTPEMVWNETKKYSGITKEFYDEYYKNRDTAIAYRLGKIHIFDEPLSLEDYNVKFAPQSFIYLD